VIAKLPLVFVAFALAELPLIGQGRDGVIVRVDRNGDESHISATFTIHRDINAVWACLKDVAAYGEIFSEYRSVIVVDRRGNVEIVDYTLSAFPVIYRIERVYDEGEKLFSWKLVSSDWVRTIRGSYVLEREGDDTVLHLESAIALKSAILNGIAGATVERTTRYSISELTRYLERDAVK
jgi:hypothetical protein